MNSVLDNTYSDEDDIILLEEANYYDIKRILSRPNVSPLVVYKAIERINEIGFPGTASTEELLSMANNIINKNNEKRRKL